MFLAFAIIIILLALVALLSPAATATAGVALMASLKPLVTPVIDLLNSPLFVVAASTILIVSALMVCWQHWQNHTKMATADYERFERHLQKEAPSQGIENRPWQETEAKIGEVVRTYQIFPVAWAMLATDIAENGRMPAKPFAAYVSEDPITAERESGGLLRSLPGYYITFGLILTFLGLVAALYFAAKGFRSGNMEEARTAITELLNAASFKFLTSVAALAASFFISLFARWSELRVRAARESAVQSVETLLRLARSAAHRPDPVLQQLKAIEVALQKLGAPGMAKGS